MTTATFVSRTAAAAVAMLLMASACGSDDGAEVRNLSEDSETDSTDSSSSASASEPAETETE